MNHMMIVTALAAAILPMSAARGVPLELAHQGRILNNGTNVDGTGHFKFALVVGGRQATASADIIHGRIVSITVNDGGFGYVFPPRVNISDPFGFGSGARATAQIGGARSQQSRSPIPGATIRP